MILLEKKEKRECYLYRHIRLDTNEVFYIGIGHDNRYIDNNSRNRHWNFIVKNHGYKSEIMMRSYDYEFIKNKEIEFIKLYGRRDLKTGSLVNMTDGGDGTLGLKHTDEWKSNHSNTMKGENNPSYGVKLIG